MGQQVCEFTPDKERVHCPVMSGTFGPRGTFSDGNLSWAGAAIDMNPRYAAESITAGRDAHQQHRAARLAHASGRGSGRLTVRGVPEVVSTLASRLDGYKEGRRIWIARMRALEWVEFQIHAKLMTKTRALGEVATAFGIDADSVEDLTDKATDLFEEVWENLEWSGAKGGRYHSIRKQLDSGKLEKSLVAHELEYLTGQFGWEHLNAIAMIYKGRRRRRDKRRRAVAGGKRDARSPLSLSQRRKYPRRRIRTPGSVCMPAYLRLTEPENVKCRIIQGSLMIYLPVRSRR